MTGHDNKETKPYLVLFIGRDVLHLSVRCRCPSCLWESPMSEEKMIAETQSYAYASAYAIQVIPSENNEQTTNDLPLYLAEDGATTCWPCDAWLFDTFEDTARELMKLGEPNYRPVHISFAAEVKPASIVRDWSEPIERVA